MRFFTSIVTSCKDVAKRFRLVSAKANDQETENRQLMQQYGFISVPKSGAKVLFLELDNMIVGVASESEDRPALDEGESAVYRAVDHFIILKKDGTIAVKAGGGVDIDGDLRVKGEVSDSTGKLSTLRQNFNQHTHVGNLGAPTATPVPQDAGDASA